MESTLRIPEILHAILNHLPGPSLVACSSACKFWSDAATDIIWSRATIRPIELINLIPALRRLLLLYRLGYLNSSNVCPFTFMGAPRQPDLESKLTLMEEAGIGSKLEGQVVATIVRNLLIV